MQSNQRAAVVLTRTPPVLAFEFLASGLSSCN